MNDMNNNIVSTQQGILTNQMYHQQVYIKVRDNIPNYRKWIFWDLWSHDILHIMIPFVVISLRVETASGFLRYLPHLGNVTGLIMSRIFT